MKKQKKIYIILLSLFIMGIGFFITVSGWAFTGCSLSEANPFVTSISPTNITIDFGCDGISSINGQVGDKIEVISKTNLPFGGVTAEGDPDASQPWNLTVVIDGQTIVAEGEYGFQYKKNAAEIGPWLMLIGFVLFIVSLFIKKERVPDQNVQDTESQKEELMNK